MTNEIYTNEEEAIKILEEAIDVINHQKKEIKILRDYNKDMFAEIKKLNSIIVSDDVTKNQKRIKREAKIEAYKEFAEKLKRHKRKIKGLDLNEEFWDDCVGVEDIDDLLKELVGDED